MIMLKQVRLAGLGLAALGLLAAPAGAFPLAVPSTPEIQATPVAGGCGEGRWRGPWGHCRDTPYYGPLPGGYYQPRPHPFFGCPPGYWRGPWGHCRDTPYHGRLPDGGWK
jgi:hypothetical protein